MRKLIVCIGLLYAVVPEMIVAYYNPDTEIVQNALEANMHHLSSHSLNRYGKSVYSQYGDDGIIEEIFSRMRIDKGFFVEFGANDGIFLSNTRYLLEKGWEGVMIESDSSLFAKLETNYHNRPDVLLIREFVTWSPTDQRGKFFDQIKQDEFPDKEIDFLSIDIDGGDYFILKTLKCRPKVIAIENGLKWYPLIEQEVPEAIAIQNLHQPLEVVISYAKSIGYRAVCSTNNLFLVRDDFAYLFADVPNDALTIYRDAFRALPNKDWWLFWRSQPIITSFEKGVFEKPLPLTENF